MKWSKHFFDTKKIPFIPVIFFFHVLIFPVHQQWVQKRLLGNLTSTKKKMKKFLAFLLIAIVECTTVENLNFESWWDGIVEFFKGGWNWLKKTES